MLNIKSVNAILMLAIKKPFFACATVFSWMTYNNQIYIVVVSFLIALSTQGLPLLLWKVSCELWNYACYVSHIKCLFFKLFEIDEVYVKGQAMNRLGKNFNYLPNTSDILVYTIVTSRDVFFPISALADKFCKFVQLILPFVSRDL